MIRIETHCHSHHSFDCNSSIEGIIDSCKQRGIEGIVICDHDVCDITPEEEALFSKSGIRLFKAIEFTTKTDAHVIGVSPKIKELQKERFYYSLGELIDELIAIRATIIIPHPNHVTGIIGNGKISDVEIDKALSAAHLVEKDNFRYGKTTWNQQKLYSQIKWVIGSDAHSAKNVGAFVNEVSEIKGDFLSIILSGKITHRRNMVHGRGYWMMKSVKASAVYQFLLKLFPTELRRKVKNMIMNK